MNEAETLVAKQRPGRAPTTVGYRDIVRALREVGMDCQSRRVIAHVSLSSFGQVKGGAESVVAALTNVCKTLVMPAFTYQTLVIPETGPPDNGIAYGMESERNADAEFWMPDLAVHAEIGAVAEQLRRLPGAVRSDHPVLSFVAYGQEAQEVIASQSLEQPLGPIAWLAEHDGDVLLVGVSHRMNTAIHLGERLAGRKTFVRWALTRQQVVEVPHWPGNSAGFDAVAPHVADVTVRGQVGTANVQRIPLRDLLDITVDLIKADPTALLTDDPSDERSNAIRRSLQTSP